MRLSELLGREVVSASGERRGRIHDVRGEIVGGSLRVTGLVAGGLGVVERYGARSPELSALPAQKAHDHPVIPWGRVVLTDAASVIVRDD